MYARHIKRLIDLALTIPALILLAPVLMLLCVLVRLKLGSPVFFRQPRAGLRGQQFTLCKFRTMLNIYDHHGNLLPDEQRLTVFGQFLRSTSLDELPELLHVLTGEMSLVGPRPLLVAYLDRYTAEQMRRHNVKPGITGWAQVNGRNGISWEERFALDLWYVQHQSLSLDLNIIVQTIWKVIKREGIGEQGYATSSMFLGSRQEDV
jgi:sugar transferase EpsL